MMRINRPEPNHAGLHQRVGRFMTLAAQHPEVRLRHGRQVLPIPQMMHVELLCGPTDRTVVPLSSFRLPFLLPVGGFQIVPIRIRAQDRRPLNPAILVAGPVGFCGPVSSSAECPAPVAVRQRLPLAFHSPFVPANWIALLRGPSWLCRRALGRFRCLQSASRDYLEFVRRTAHLQSRGVQHGEFGLGLR